MKSHIKTRAFTVNIDLDAQFVRDLIPLLRKGGGEDGWTLSQRQTFNCLATKLQETVDATDHIVIGT